ncbi:non-ribosomal peptide synthetase [Tumebacillus avium]|uniref:non-ribosomal peptide synthetase n=1 Tax=Tumebacillus avium TaxID=1903704 RepID=UPI0018E04BEC|nr:non-ribosomal peptide synthetase [Tumebacillus avium]
METKPQIQQIYPMTPMQEGMMAYSLLYPKSGVYFEQLTLSLEGELHRAAFAESFRQLVARYDILRTIFVHQNMERPRQVVLKERSVDIDWQDISGLAPEQQTAFIASFKEQDKKRGFDISRDVLMRVSVLQTAADACTVVWSFHHILMDGWCNGIVMGEFFQIYRSLTQGTQLQLGEVKPYSDYIKWLKKQDREAAEAHWLNELAGYDQAAVLPLRKTPAAPGASRQEKVVFTLDETVKSGLQNLANKQQATLNSVFQAIWGIMLQRCNHTDDVVFGSVVSGRPAEIPGIETMVGLFINLVPVRVQSTGDTSFSELVRRVQERALAGEKHDFYPFPDLQLKTPLKDELVDHILVFENFPVDQKLARELGEDNVGFTVREAEMFEQTNFNLDVIVMTGDTLTVQLKYNALVYDRAVIERVEGHLRTIIGQVLSNPQLLISEISLLTAEEQTQIAAWNLTAAPYPQDTTLAGLFARQAAKTPDKAAAIFDDRTLSYRELQERSNAAARQLREGGVGPGSIVALLAERSPELIIGILAILKAGGAYLPLDPHHPLERTRYILTDSGAGVLLVQGAESLLGDADFAGTVIGLNDLLSGGDVADLELMSGPTDLAYVIYTSGSTGQPKGALIEQHSVINRLAWMQKQFPLTDQDVILQKTPFTFDVSVWELFWWMLAGASVCFLQPGGEKEPEQVIDAVGRHGVTVMHFVPSMLSVFLDVLEAGGRRGELGTLRYVFASGEALGVKQAVRFKRQLQAHHGTRLINLYGPTEATVDVSWYDCSQPGEPDLIPIGKPIDNHQLYVMDAYGHPQPVGVSGELYIAGTGLARGYLNRPELTAEKFVAHELAPAGRMYRTGDLARWLPDGNIEYLGRIDHQVKIRGFRIELGEIEAQLLEAEGVKAAVVIAHTHSNGSQMLIAYVTASHTLETQKLRDHLARTLPDYMIPAQFIQLDSIPLNANGKADRKALPAADLQVGTGTAYEAPGTELETALAEIWQKLLGVERVGVHDNFFELGGQSLLAVKMEVEIENLDLPIEDAAIYTHRTIRELAAHIERLQAEEGVTKR